MGHFYREIQYKLGKIFLSRLLCPQVMINIFQSLAIWILLHSKYGRNKNIIIQLYSIILYILVKI